jgi:hypothetical protein
LAGGHKIRQPLTINRVPAWRDKCGLDKTIYRMAFLPQQNKIEKILYDKISYLGLGSHLVGLLPK